MRLAWFTSAVLAAAIAAPAAAADITIRMRAISAQGVGADIGWIRAVDTKNGLLLVPRLSGLEPGAHGFHLHENPKCGPKAADGRTGAGLAAGGHFDPAKTGRHEGPSGTGHLGDLPLLLVDGSGAARQKMIAPRLKVADLWERALVVHASGDNYSDRPDALGGGGARVACGTIVRARK